MIKDTISNIKKKLSESNAIDATNKEQLLNLITDLEKEVVELAKTDPSQAESILGFTNISFHEATKDDKDPNLMNIALDGLSKSIRRFEVSHPTLTAAVNRVCQSFADIGI